LKNETRISNLEKEVKDLRNEHINLLKQIHWINSGEVDAAAEMTEYCTNRILELEK
jgi:peptidoglycan hydrolase CwlO-like protein